MGRIVLKAYHKHMWKISNSASANSSWIRAQKQKLYILPWLTNWRPSHCHEFFSSNSSFFRFRTFYFPLKSSNICSPNVHVSISAKISAKPTTERVAEFGKVWNANAIPFFEFICIMELCYTARLPWIHQNAYLLIHSNAFETKAHLLPPIRGYFIHCQSVKWKRYMT